MQEEESLRDLAEEEMEDKREEVGNEEQVHELYDVPTESASELAEQQGGSEQG